MICREVVLSGQAKMSTYFLDNFENLDPRRKRPVVLICPGGGYEKTSEREAEGVAVQLLAAGFHAAVLWYSVAPARFPQALREAAAGVAWLREHGEEFHIREDRVFLMGFSAGGHLAASLGVFWDQDFLADLRKEKARELRPDGLLLCYPVIDFLQVPHEGSLQNLAGERKEELRARLSLETQVGPQVPPAFLWHTQADNQVPVKNSLLFYEALLEQGIPAELHLFPRGGHGMALATAETAREQRHIQRESAQWMELAKNWIRAFD